MMRKLRWIWSLIWDTCRYPRTRKQGWLLVAAWSIALFLPALSIALSPNYRGLDFTIWVGWSNAVCIFLDGFMLYTAIRGLVWKYQNPDIVAE